MLNDEIAATLAGYPTATIYEALGKAGAMLPAIRPLLRRSRLAGIAYTIRILPAETAAVLRAIDEAPAGAVLVIDAGDTGVSSVWGGTSSLASAIRGLRGCVTNGYARDLDEMIDLCVPVYAAGVAVTGTLKNHPGWTNIPVAVGGVVVHPGDFVIGDSDGVVIVPQDEGERAIAASQKQLEKEQARDARVRAGEPLASILSLR